MNTTVRTLPQISSTARTGRQLRAAALGLVVAAAVSACAVFPNPVVGLGGRSTASMNTGLTFEDIRMADSALVQALDGAPDGAGTNWSNPRSGASGAFQMQRSFIDNLGRQCRGYQELVVIRGAREGYNVSACRIQGGNWERLELL
ncbi:MAG: hypothetical protein O7A03_08230 [Alphaproteobacteria bacterium]|nr:hypothetical protein [Alphaproteobacteria bacterium]